MEIFFILFQFLVYVCAADASTVCTFEYSLGFWHYKMFLSESYQIQENQPFLHIPFLSSIEIQDLGAGLVLMIACFY